MPNDPTVTDASHPLDNNITAFFHCALCLAEKPPGVTPREWVSIEAGWTKSGFQVWCKRHEANIIHIDFEGTKHPAWTNRKAGA